MPNAHVSLSAVALLPPSMPSGAIHRREPMAGDAGAIPNEGSSMKACSNPESNARPSSATSTLYYKTGLVCSESMH